MVYISDEGTAKTAINHDIVVKGKCVICGKNMTDPRDGLFKCFECRSSELRADARYHLKQILDLNKDLPKEKADKIKDLIKELSD